jgi:hypothetical protein
MPLAHACNPCYSGGSWQIVQVAPLKKTHHKKKVWWSGSRYRSLVQTIVLKKKKKKKRKEKRKSFRHCQAILSRNSLLAAKRGNKITYLFLYLYALASVLLNKVQIISVKLYPQASALNKCASNLLYVLEIRTV